jgi:hypothetical protein
MEIKAQWVEIKDIQVVLHINNHNNYPQEDTDSKNKEDLEVKEDQDFNKEFAVNFKMGSVLE